MYFSLIPYPFVDIIVIVEMKTSRSFFVVQESIGAEGDGLSEYAGAEMQDYTSIEAHNSAVGEEHERPSCSSACVEALFCP